MFSPPWVGGPINILIGPNAAGKSNLIAFFKLLNEMSQGRLQEFIATSGGANSVLHLGSKHTPALEAALDFNEGSDSVRYGLRLIYAAADTLVFSEERVAHTDHRGDWDYWPSMGTGHKETLLRRYLKSPSQVEPFEGVLELPPIPQHPYEQLAERSLGRCRVFHFHDTSATSGFRRLSQIEHNRQLFSDGANLAAMLYLFREKYEVAYSRIVSTIRKISPSFDDFVLQPRRLDPKSIFLNWKGRVSDYEFGPHQLSDGTLRAMALVTLLLQPPEELPGLIVIDEPELGLHPQAVTIFAGLIRAAAERAQIIVATQSAALVDNFDPEEVIVTEVEEGVTSFRRLSRDQLGAWLEDYALGELWERNVVGGGPFLEEALCRLRRPDGAAVL